mmetsp:Transcript_16230/g.35956  ORF Transcript_16230/g.35956 Transcript_16230/m.35956 type:complete len:565 (+) Transcript_16230:124-1818(+)
MVLNLLLQGWMASGAMVITENGVVSRHTQEPVVAARTGVDDMQSLQALLASFQQEVDDQSTKAARDFSARMDQMEAAMTGVGDDPSEVDLLDDLQKNIEFQNATHGDAQVALQELRAALGVIQPFVGEGDVTSCIDLKCSPHAGCVRHTGKSQCVCHEGYIGNGHTCRPPADFVPVKLIQDAAADDPRTVADLHVAAHGHRVAVVYRDTTGGRHSGMVKTGLLEGNSILWGTREMFSGEGKAFGCKVLLPGKDSLVVAYRSANAAGTGIVRAAKVGEGSSIHKLAWSPAVEFAEHQAHGVALLSLSPTVFGVFHTRSVGIPDSELVRQSGVMTLFEAAEPGVVEMIPSGQYEFSHHPTVRIHAAHLGGEDFAVAFRAARHVDDMDPTKVTRQEASVVHGKYRVVDGQHEVVMAAAPLHLEPEDKSIFARSITAVGHGKAAYAYSTTTTPGIRLATLAIAPEGHLAVTDGPHMIHPLGSDYITSIGRAAHTITFFQGGPGAGSLASICGVGSAGEVSDCEDFQWMHNVTSGASAVPMPGGRVLVGFVTTAGVPFTHLMAVAQRAG